jgi:HrpA-like RNA helicase
MGRKLPTDQLAVFPGGPNRKEKFNERNRVVKRMLAERAGLPKPEDSRFGNLGNREVNAYQKKEQMQRAIRDYPISAHEGPTGSGKSTQLAQFALEMGYRVIHLVPRRLTADNLGERLQFELAEQLGAEAAFHVGIHHGERNENPEALVTVMTPGTFLRVMPDLKKYSDDPLVVIGDEIHEKDFETDMAVAVAAMNLEMHPKWRLALVSATMDKEAVDSTYTKFSNGILPHVFVEGRPYQLETVEEPELDPVEVYMKYSMGHERTIIFTTGKQEIKDTITALRKVVDERKTKIVPLHSKLPRSEVRKATNAELRPGEKLVIVSTSVAQSGITIPGLTLAILDGTVRRPHLDEDGVNGLFKMYSAKDELIQEGGRAGRDVGGGLAILSKSSDEKFGFKSYDDRDDQAPAQIYSINLARNVLLATSLGYSFYDVNEYLMNGVERSRILGALEVLWRLQAIDEHNNITEIGEAMNQLPLRPELARAVVEAQRRGATGENLRQLIAIVSSIDAGGLQYYKSGVPEHWKKDIQEHTSDDVIAQFDLFRFSRKFYDGMTVNEVALLQRSYDPKNTEQAHKTYDKICKTLGIEDDSLQSKIIPIRPKDIEFIHDYLTAGLFDFAHQRVRVESSRSKKVAWYDEAFRDITSMRRISDRSLLPQDGPEFVIGLPRSYEKSVKGELSKFNVIEFNMPTSIKKLSKHVMHLTVFKNDGPPRLVNGVLRQPVGVYFGDIKIANDSQTQMGVVHTEESRKILEEGIFNKPTQTITELVGIKKELESLARKVTNTIFSTVFPNGLLTEDWLHEMVDDAITDDVDSIYALDNKLRARVVREGISLRTWISEEHERLVREHSPDFINLSETVSYPIYWSKGKPIINGFNLQDIALLPEKGLFLQDGRQVYFSYKNKKNDTKRVTAAVLIREQAH